MGRTSIKCRESEKAPISSKEEACFRACIENGPKKEEKIRSHYWSNRYYIDINAFCKAAQASWEDVYFDEEKIKTICAVHLYLMTGSNDQRLIRNRIIPSY